MTTTIKDRIDSVKVDFDKYFQGTEDELSSDDKIAKAIVDNLISQDEKNRIDFKVAYAGWIEAGESGNRYDQLTAYSRVREVLAAVLIGSPSSLGLPRWAFWTTSDKARCATWFFEPKRQSNAMHKECMLYTTRKMYLLKNGIAEKISKFSLFAGTAIGLTQYAAVKFSTFNMVNKGAFIITVLGIAGFFAKEQLSKFIPKTVSKKLPWILVASGLSLFLGNTAYQTYSEQAAKNKQIADSQQGNELSLDSSFKEISIRNSQLVNRISKNDTAANREFIELLAKDIVGFSDTVASFHDGKAISNAAVAKARTEINGLIQDDVPTILSLREKNVLNDKDVDSLKSQAEQINKKLQ